MVGVTAYNHQINECTFKNAEEAIKMQSSADAQINANTFTNCNKGIVLLNSVLNQSIIANNFMLNNAYLDFSVCGNITLPNNASCIFVLGVAQEMDQEHPINLNISQNTMVKSITKSVVNVYGIDVINALGSISENTLTNMTEAIRITRPLRLVNIENNEMETNSLDNILGINTSQININNTTGALVLISNNELVNTSLLNNATRVAINANRSRNITIQNNNIEGFDQSIFLNSTTAVNVSENIITSDLLTGGYLDEGNFKSENFITCNDITMVMNNGIGISTLRASINTNITSNCVKDGNIGLKTQGADLIPFIRNNFFYNYTVGIQNIGHTET